MSGIISLGYVRIEARDLDAWRRFGTDVLGAVEGTGPDPSALYLRLDEFPARLVVLPGEKDRLVTIGFEAPTAEDVARIAGRLDRAGIAAKQASAEELADRRVCDLVRFDDPYGNAVEVFSGAFLDGTPFLSPVGARFVTGTGGMGHVVIGTADVDPGLAFYRDVLGLRLRDTMQVPAFAAGLAESAGPLWMKFLGCGPRHHSLALAPFTHPTGIIHVMVEVDTLDNVGRAVDRASATRGVLASTMGRHANDNMVSCYLNTPSGFMIEYGYDGITVADDEAWVPHVTGAHTVWGHRWLRGGGGH
ncbi:MAG TPA: VOC family protein [Micromonosporaceae bacterium]|jgi:3,4-dihydroxy-9,10-secoandrosta-1,3,5(10)-triene-9,17-dione 4,5-dioxygenase